MADVYNNTGIYQRVDHGSSGSVQIGDNSANDNNSSVVQGNMTENDWETLREFLVDALEGNDISKLCNDACKQALEDVRKRDEKGLKGHLQEVGGAVLNSMLAACTNVAADTVGGIIKSLLN